MLCDVWHFIDVALQEVGVLVLLRQGFKLGGNGMAWATPVQKAGQLEGVATMVCYQVA